MECLYAWWASPHAPKKIAKRAPLGEMYTLLKTISWAGGEAGMVCDMNHYLIIFFVFKMWPCASHKRKRERKDEDARTHVGAPEPRNYPWADDKCVISFLITCDSLSSGDHAVISESCLHKMNPVPRWMSYLTWVTNPSRFWLLMGAAVSFFCPVLKTFKGEVQKLIHNNMVLE